MAIYVFDPEGTIWTADYQNLAKLEAIYVNFITEVAAITTVIKQQLHMSLIKTRSLG